MTYYICVHIIISHACLVISIRMVNEIDKKKKKKLKKMLKD